MTTLRDIALARGQTLDTKEDKPPKYRAVIVEQRDSSGKDGVYVEGRVYPFYLWVRMWNAGGSVLPAFNADNVPAIAGMPVNVTRSRGSDQELEIVGIDKEMLQATDLPVGFSNIGQHGWAHEMPDGAPGFDPVLVYPRAWSQLRAYSSDPLSLVVNVSPLRYYVGSTSVSFDGGTVDLTAAVGALAAGQARLVLIYLNRLTNVLGTTNGAIGVDAAGWFLAEPAMTTATYPIAVVRIYNGQTEVGESDIKDRRMFLDVAGVSGWPFDTKVITVDTTDLDADVATIADAITASVAGDLILVSPETHTCDNQSLIAGVNLAGLDRDATLLQTTTQVIALTINNNCYLFRLTIDNDQTNAATITAILIDEHTSELRDVIAIADNDGAGDARAISTSVGVKALRLEDCDAKAISGAGDGYALYADGTGEIEVRGGKYDGDTADIFADAGVTVVLYGPTLVNSTFAGAGTVKGWYYDADGDLIPIDHSMLGDTIFSEDDGLLLLDFQRWEQHGSGAARANYIVGSRLERARVGVNNAVAGSRGALHFEPGRWQNKRALVVEEATTNLVTNPSIETDIVAWGNYGVAPTTKAKVSTRARYGVCSLHVVCAAALSGVEHRNVAGNNGDVFIASVWIYGTGALIGDTLEIFTRDYTNAVVGAITAYTIVQGWQRIVTPTQTLTANSADFAVVIRNTAGSTDEFWLDGAQIEKQPCATTYCDGDQGDGYSWTGVNHASASSRIASYVHLDDYAGLVSDNNTMSFRTVVQMPRDADVTWPTASNFIFDTKGANDNNRIFLFFDTNTDTLRVYINGGYRLQSSVLTFKAGDWLDIEVICDFTDDIYKLYIDGGLADADTTALAAPTLTVWNVGSSDVESNQGGFTFAEYAVFDTILTATEVAILFAGQRPLIDCAAIENRPTVPGVSAGVWDICFRFTEPNAAYTEAYFASAPDSRITFAGAWVCGLVQFESNLHISAGAGTAYAKLQYFDTSTGAWRDVPNSEITAAAVTPDRKRSPPLAVPEQEYEYRVVAKAAGGVVAVGYYSKIIVSPGGDYDNL